MKESLDFGLVAGTDHGILRRALHQVVQSFALAGGLVVIALIGMSVVSLVGRKLFSMPIRGDMELVEVGAAVAVAAFLPLCELRGMHIKVDVLTAWLPARARRSLDGLGHLLCALAAWVLAWRTWLQMHDSREYGDVTTLLSFPLWVPLLLIVPSLLLLGICGLVRAYDAFRFQGGEA